MGASLSFLKSTLPASRNSRKHMAVYQELTSYGCSWSLKRDDPCKCRETWSWETQTLAFTPFWRVMSRPALSPEAHLITAITVCPLEAQLEQGSSAVHGALKAGGRNHVQIVSLRTVAHLTEGPSFHGDTLPEAALPDTVFL